MTSPWYRRIFIRSMRAASRSSPVAARVWGGSWVTRISLEGPRVCRLAAGGGKSRANPSLKPKFSASRENTGNFIDSGLGRASTVEKASIISIFYGPIPYASEQGIFCGLAGNLNRRSGKISALISEFRSRPLFWPTNSDPPRDLERCQQGKSARYISRSKTHGPRHPTDLARRPARA
jgi:hypothetical protein